jgi:alkylhydroperoxidase family enzyme
VRRGTHSARVQERGAGRGTVEAIRALGAIAAARLDAVARFTKAVIAERGRVDDVELEAFRAAGFGDGAALEVVLGVSLATLCNFANNLAQPPLDPQLDAYRWDPPQPAAAE